MYRAAGNPGVIVRQTVYGLAARERPGSMFSSLAAPGSELVTLLFCGVAIFLSGLGYVAMTSGDSIFLLLVLFSVLVLCYIAQAQGLNSEVRLDTTARKILRGRVNRMGDFRLSKSFCLAEIESIYIMRSRRKAQPARMYIRCKRAGIPKMLLQGPERELVGFLEAIVEQLKATRLTNRASRINSDFRMHSFNVGH